MIEITMPRLSDTMEEGAISAWRKQPGDRVEVGEVLVEIETDKAIMELEAYEAGTLATILVPEGELVPIGAPIALLDDGTPSESSAPAVPPRERAESFVADSAPSAATEPGDGSRATAERGDGDRLFASPLARKLAREARIDLREVRGSGPGGRIIRTDLGEALSHAGGASPSAAEDSAEAPVEVSAGAPALSTESGTATAPTKQIDEKRASEAVPISNTRRVIARRLGDSARSIPHFYVTAVADAEALVRLRTELNEQLTAAGRPKVSVNDLLIRASALALREHPQVNASYLDDASTTMLVHHRINVGVAVASENGLVVPVIENADQKSVSQLGSETRGLVALANAKKLTTEQMSGGTFTISNLGMFGVEGFTAIINPPEGAILAVGGTVREPVVLGDEIVPRYRMRYTLSADHRIIDGALAARFLQTLTRLIENPGSIVA